jgi:hypothetical protein
METAMGEFMELNFYQLDIQKYLQAKSSCGITTKEDAKRTRILLNKMRN